MALADELKKVMRGEVETAPAVLEAAARDASLFYVKPEVVAHPMDAADICAAVKLVSAIKKDKPDSTVSLTARSAGTDMGGGPLTNSVVLESGQTFTIKCDKMGGEMANFGYVTFLKTIKADKNDPTWGTYGCPMKESSAAPVATTP